MNYDSMMQRLWLSSSTVLLMMKYSTLKLMQYYLFLDDEMHTIEREKEKNKDKVASCLVYMENLLSFSRSLRSLTLLLFSPCLIIPSRNLARNTCCSHFCR